MISETQNGEDHVVSALPRLLRYYHDIDLTSYSTEFNSTKIGILPSLTVARLGFHHQPSISLSPSI